MLVFPRGTYSVWSTEALVMRHGGNNEERTCTSLSLKVGCFAEHAATQCVADELELADWSSNVVGCVNLGRGGIANRLKRKKEKGKSYPPYSNIFHCTVSAFSQEMTNGVICMKGLCIIHRDPDDIVLCHL